MLTSIHIRDFAIAESLSLEFSPGMTVLTGETGAGKSILLDALGLALGDRGDSGSVRQGAPRAEISVSFAIEGAPDILAWLQENALDEGDECLIRRTLDREGRSKGFINGRPAPMLSLRELGERLVDIHGQHAHQSLLRRDAQREVLDAYAGLGTLGADMQAAYQTLADLRHQREELLRSQAERSARLELLRYQTDELAALNPHDGENERLEEEHHRLANVQRLQELSEQALYELRDNESGALLDRLDRIQSQFDELADLDGGAQSAGELFRNGLVQLQEAAAELRHYRDRVEGDPERLRELEERIAALNDLARKHHVSMAELPRLCADLQTELREVETSQVQLAGLDERVSAAEQACTALAGKLTQARRKAAKRLAKAVISNMARLGMANGQFAIELIPLNDIGAHGAETVEFQVTTNPGQPLRPIVKVASGGELSRISLALQVIIAGSGRIPTLIFDEVDVGIGGGTAEVVGRLLHQLGRDRQVICVTHQPQVAALADQHLLVRKLTGDMTTHTSVRELPRNERVEEIARMLGGLEITEQTRSHALEMLERAG